MHYLKQSTAITLKIGPFLDDTDGKTAETGLTITQADVRLSKNGGDIAQKTEATSCTHDELGVYGCPIDATDTATLGRLQLWVHEAGALPVFVDYMVVAANFYDSLFSTDKLQVDLTQIGGVAQSATDLKDFADAGYDPATNKIEGVKLADTTTTNTDMRGTDSAATATALTTVDTVVDGIQTDLSNATDGLGALKALIDTVDEVVDTILVDTNELQTDWVNGGRLDLIIDAILADVTGIAGDAMRGTDSAALAATALSTATWTAAKAAFLDHSIATVDGVVDTILADTNELQTDWVNGGRLDLIIDAILADVTGIAGDAMRGTDSAATATNLATVDTVVDGIQTDLSNATDGLGALKALIDTVDGVVDAILVDTSTTLQDDLTFIRDEAGGKWQIINNQMIFYKEDASELMRFNLFDAAGDPAMTDVYKRERV